MRFITTLFFMFSQLINASAATISGIITDEQNNPLSFASVYLKGTTSGVTANVEGKYVLLLAVGEYDVVFQYVGYMKKTEHIIVGTDNIILNVKLLPENFKLKEVVISSNAEDPAYRVIRNAIKKRPDYLSEINEYKCHVYIKGMQRLDSIPKRIMGFKADDLGLDSSMLGIVYLSESESEFNFKQPDRVREIMISSKVSGDNQAFSWNQASDFDFNFYRNLIDAGNLSDRGFVSPISESAMMYYRYKMIGAYYEEGLLINKIQVIPRRRNDPVFSGYIYIVEDTWRIHSTDLYLTKEAKIDFVDSLEIIQTYNKVNNDVWMPYTQTMLFWFRAFGIKGNGRYVGVFNDYNLNPQFPKKFFKGEELKVNEDANKKDSSYWDVVRPIPLTQEEIDDYRKKDSLSRIQNSKQYLDSLDRKRNHFKFNNLYLGYNYYRRFNETNYYIGSLLQSLNFNTVEGLAPILEFGFSKEWKDRRLLGIGSAFRYGISNRLFQFNPEIEYLIKPERFRKWTINGGRYVAQFNDNNPISGLVNSLYTLGFGENYMKLYLDEYASITYQSEFINGLIGQVNVAYHNRSPLSNTNFHSWINSDQTNFTSNTTDIQNFDNTLTNYQALLFKATANIRFKQKYYTRPHQKVIIGSKYPTLKLFYTKGIAALGSDVNFDLIEAQISDKMKLGLLGYFTYQGSAGYFFNKNIIRVAEYKHFTANQTMFSGFSSVSRFELLPYYRYSTNQYYAQIHAEQHFQGFITNKIPLLRKLKMKETAGAHLLYTPDVLHYEFHAGLERILKIFRVEWVSGYNKFSGWQQGIRLGIMLQGGLISVGD